MNACCGHGRDEIAYIQYWDEDRVKEGGRIKGAAAIAEQERLLDLRGELIGDD